MTTIGKNELLIASLSPQNLARGIFWFKENETSIKKARFTNPWWRDHTLAIEKDLVIKPTELTLRILGLGYERSSKISGPGLFAWRGGIIEVWPINQEKPYLIEFKGNIINSIYEFREKEKEETSLLPKKLTSLEKLQPGEFLVHIDHGIGIFKEIVTPPLNKEEYFVIEYAPARRGGEPDKLFVPVLEKDRLSPYVGFDTPIIHRLGGTLWQNTKRKVREDVEKLAQSLLELYTKRSIASRPPHLGDLVIETELNDTFPFIETEDQIRATEDIMTDLSKTYPMDRILCGDVGFGKTEVAIRATARVIASGKQVAVLTPTTILAAQHEKTFQERLSGQLPIIISMLSRLTLPQEGKKVLRDLAEGKIDCLIGTHRLLSQDLKFKNLGLLIIDEEQRFGVKQKEHFKNLRAEIDILSLSATPIPRTLSLALAKFRDISLINTPPPERLAIKTLVLPHSPKTIKGALEFEIKRGGQVYFLHNRIETLGVTKNRLEKSISKLSGFKPKIGILHGRLPEKEIIKTMEEFRKKEIKILVTTTIIENGLDISSANTLIVDDATRLGLAQAHQLRGRIGRNKEQAFAYFLYRPYHLVEKAAERLEALKKYAELGDGYQIALRDLEIRGAGNILGREQSGAVNKVGLNLYCQILNEALEDQKRGVLNTF